MGMLESQDGYLEQLLARLRTAPAPVPPTPAPAAVSKVEPVAESTSASFWQQLRTDSKDQPPAVLPSAAAASAEARRAEPTPPPIPAPKKNNFLPLEPTTLEQSGLQGPELEDLILRVLLNRTSASGRNIAQQIRLPFNIVHELLTNLRTDQLIGYKGAAVAGDYHYQLTPAGREQARRLYEHSTYIGSAPVTLEQYIAAISAQSLQHSHPRFDDLKRAFHDLLMRDETLHRLVQAVHHGRGLFLHGSPGNGKTSIATRLTRAFGESLWIPRAIGIDGDIIRVYDPCVHDELPYQTSKAPGSAQIDQRWIRIRRPTIMVGGELTMDRLEVSRNATTGTCEAPLQLKSNCGTLVIDDFGRQRMSTAELLNRWIVPLDKGYDFLNLPSGKTIQVPFDQMIAFSTNLEPRDLVDEAFLRRIPYKIEVIDPTEDEFRELLKREAADLGVKYHDAVIDHLIITHYHGHNRPFRACQPRDLLRQVRTFCQVQGIPVEMTNTAFDIAVSNYFAVM